jgi:hypothetical protein
MDVARPRSTQSNPAARQTPDDGLWVFILMFLLFSWDERIRVSIAKRVPDNGK